MNPTTSPPLTQHVAMTVDQARCVVWPFRTRPNMRGRRIGDLLDAHQLTAEHLSWAIQHSYNPGVQNACRVLLETLPESPTCIADADADAEFEIDIDDEPARVTIQRLEIPAVCPTCGSATRVDWRWSSAQRGRAWRCEQAGLQHYLLLRLQPVIEAARKREWIIPPAEGYAGIRVEDFRAGRIGEERRLHYGYHPDFNR